MPLDCMDLVQNWELAKVALSCHTALDNDVYTKCLVGMNVGFQTCLGKVNSRREEGGLFPCAGIEAENSQRVD